MIGGFGVFVMTQMGVSLEADVSLIAPLATSFVLFTGITLLNQFVFKIEIKPGVEELLEDLSSDKKIA